MERVTVTVKGMSCEHCRMTVESAIKALAGVKEARVDLESASATVSYDARQLGLQDLKSAIEQKGYSAEMPA